MLRTRDLSFPDLQRIGRFARFWDLIANSGNFVHTLALIRAQASARADQSLFFAFGELSEFLSTRHPQGSGVALLNLVESIWLWFRQPAQFHAEEIVREALVRDYAEGPVRRDVPGFLRTGEVPKLGKDPAAFRPEQRRNIPARQERHRQMDPSAPRRIRQ